MKKLLLIFALLFFVGCEQESKSVKKLPMQIAPDTTTKYYAFVFQNVINDQELCIEITQDSVLVYGDMPYNKAAELFFENLVWFYKTKVDSLRVAQRTIKSLQTELDDIQNKYYLEIIFKNYDAAVTFGTVSADAKIEKDAIPTFNHLPDSSQIDNNPR